MSELENYDEASNVYDSIRSASGSDVMAAMIQFYSGKQLKDLHVLDAGCGTGNYAVDFIKYGVGTMTLLDASPGMLEKARNKLTDHIKSGRVKDIVEAKLPTIPFDNNTFDAVMFNVVLHHLETASEHRDFRSTTAALTEGKRVLKPNGVIIISAALPANIRYMTWYSQIQKDITERYCKYHPDTQQWEDIFKAVGVKCVQKMNLLGYGIIKGYMNFEAPLDENWRKASSYWAEATDDEIDEVKAFILDLKAKGELEEWCKAHDRAETTGSPSVFVIRHAE